MKMGAIFIPLTEAMMKLISCQSSEIREMRTKKLKESLNINLNKGSFE
jgi:hypothetical protein